MAKSNLHIEATELECLVRDWIFQQGGELTSLEVTHDMKLEAYDSTCQIDVMAKSRDFAGAEFLVLVECKKYRNAVEQELGAEPINDVYRDENDLQLLMEALQRNLGSTSKSDPGD